jgi:hypothetical protein
MWDRRRLGTSALAACCLAACSCGYVGEPEPPSLKIPIRISDLAVTERAGRLAISFTAPAATTDNERLKRLSAIDLRAGEEGPVWESSSKPIETLATAPGPVHVDAPVAGWLGRDIVVRVRTAGKHGRYSEWSNAVRLKVVAPLEPPRISVEAVSDGVRIAWTVQAGAAAEFRVFKQGPSDERPAVAASVKSAEYLDTRAEYGKPYQYSVQAFVKTGDTEAQSERSEAVSITPVDRFAPAVPAGATATAGLNSIELSWDPDHEPDLRGYYVYRAANGGAFARLGDVITTPAFSDRAIESGKRYRYAISAIDQTGNESARSAAVEATAP